MMVNKAISKFVDDSDDRSIVGKEDKSISQKSIYSSEDNTLHIV